MTHDPQMVERVTDAVLTELGLLEFECSRNVARDIAVAALDDSHHGELVRLLKEARWYVKDSFVDEIDALLAKIGGDA